MCENCFYNQYDEEDDTYYCNLLLDEDEYARFLQDRSKMCRYFRPDVDEYAIVKKQSF